ncbi:MAG: STAS domain-containing protein [Oscillospiraceae bacterium]|jgi:anti-anti-sigma factor|nr:STAS domain-containing protein [Oscillospiraceae bacterium]
MEIDKKKDGETLTVTLKGRLDTNAAPELEKDFESSLTDEIKNLIFDFKDLVYISSAGLRVVLSTQKKMNKKSGEMKIRNANQTIKEVFEVTGFLDILNLE